MDRSSQMSDAMRNSQTAPDPGSQRSESRIGRRAIVVSGAVALSALAGCLSDDDAAATETGGNEPADPNSNEQKPSLAEFETDLAEVGVDVVAIDFEAEDEIVTLSYHSSGQSDDELADEIGTITGLFLNQLDEGMTATRLDSTITNSNEEPIAHWYVLSEWYEELQEETITPEELSIQVLQTVETE